jgi:hypothetical protein
MAESVNDWGALKRRSRLGRKHRRAKAMRLIPALRAICAHYDIDMSCNDHGYQFRKSEYVLLWSPASNKIKVQYRLSGHGDTVPFEVSGARSRNPKVVLALLKLIEVTGGQFGGRDRTRPDGQRSE